MGKSLVQAPRGTYADLAQFGAAGAFPEDGDTPQPLLKGDGTESPLSFTETKAFVNGVEIEPGGGGGGDIAGSIFAATAKTTPVDADTIGITDSAASHGLKKLTFANLWAYVKSKADTFYVSLTGAQTIAGDKTFSGVVASTSRIGFEDATGFVRIQRNSTPRFIMKDSAAYQRFLFDNSVGLFRLISSPNDDGSSGLPRVTIDGSTGVIQVYYGGSVQFDSGGSWNGSTFGGAQTFSAAISAASLRSSAYTVATLPTPAAGMRAYVTDANSTTFLSTVAGGGSNIVPVFHDGTNWKIA